MSIGIRLEQIKKSYGAVPIFRGLDLEIRPGELFALLGPSGSGKTTLLRILAGLTPIDGGRIFFASRDVTALPPAARRVGMVFQEHVNFPTLSARRNLEIVLGRRPDRREIAMKYLALVHMEAFAERLPSELSGGQQQRVALARALCVEPDVLLLDEPLSALDIALRRELAAMIREVQRALKITAVYVTHNPDDAEAVSDRIAVLGEGGTLHLIAEKTDAGA